MRMVESDCFKVLADLLLDKYCGTFLRKVPSGHKGRRLSMAPERGLVPIM